MSADKRDDRQMSAREWEEANFMEALQRIPRPVLMYDDAIICPWCGAPHGSANLVRINSCEQCKRPYCFGYPPWDADSDRPMTWVNFPHAEFQAVGGKASALEDWKPNERLTEIYRYWADHEKREDIRKRATHHVGDRLQ